LTTALKNVFDFDELESDSKEIIYSILQKHGFPMSLSGDLEIRIGREVPLVQPSKNYIWKSVMNDKGEAPLNDSWVSGKVLHRGGWSLGSSSSVKVNVDEGRNHIFSELLISTMIIDKGNVLDAIVENDQIFAITTHPVSLKILDVANWTIKSYNLHEYFPLQIGYPSLKISISGHGNIYLVNTGDKNAIHLCGSSVHSFNLPTADDTEVEVLRPFSCLALLSKPSNSITFIENDGSFRQVSFKSKLISANALSTTHILLQFQHHLSILDSPSGEIFYFKGPKVNKLHDVKQLDGECYACTIGKDAAFLLRTCPSEITCDGVILAENPFPNIPSLISNLIPYAGEFVLAHPIELRNQGCVYVINLEKKTVREFGMELKLPSEYIHQKVSKEVASKLQNSFFLFPLSRGRVIVLDNEGKDIVPPSFRILHLLTNTCRKDIGISSGNG
jgi:hypothetical protein